MSEFDELKRALEIEERTEPIATLNGVPVYDTQKYGAIQTKKLADAKLSGQLDGKPYHDPDPNALEMDANGNPTRLGRNTPIAINPDILYDNKYKVVKRVTADGSDRQDIHIIFDPIAVDGINTNNLIQSQVLVHIFRPNKRSKNGYTFFGVQRITANEAMEYTSKLKTKVAADLYSQASNNKVKSSEGDDLPIAKEESSDDK